MAPLINSYVNVEPTPNGSPGGWTPIALWLFGCVTALGTMMVTLDAGHVFPLWKVPTYTAVATGQCKRCIENKVIVQGSAKYPADGCREPCRASC